MENAFDELNKALQTARMVERASTRHAEAMAELMTANSCAVMRKVSTTELRRMKLALANFDARTGRWSK